MLMLLEVRVGLSVGVSLLLGGLLRAERLRLLASSERVHFRHFNGFEERL
jgi:hypothetical protein